MLIDGVTEVIASDPPPLLAPLPMYNTEEPWVYITLIDNVVLYLYLRCHPVWCPN